MLLITIILLTLFCSVFLYRNVFFIRINDQKRVVLDYVDDNLAWRQARSITTFVSKRKVSPSISKKVQEYIKKKEIDRLRESGASYDEVKSFIVNGTLLKDGISGSAGSARSGGYQKLLGKGSLDQRLRAIIAYKRSNVAGEMLSGDSIMSKSEEAELDLVMDSEDGDEEFVDDEEALIESLVLNALEQAKLSELKKNLLIDKAALRSKDEDTSNDDSVQSAIKNAELETDNLTGNTTNKVSEEEDLYTPARSSWGVFQRPRDISKSYGGGRTISKEEMKKMDEEFERTEKESAARINAVVNSAVKAETDNKALIEDSLQRARGYMIMGNPQRAVEILETVKSYLSYQSELGGDVWLEYAMSLETVERIDEARKVYGQLITSTWSPKVRRNAIALLQGLDMSSKIKKNLSPVKSLLDSEAMRSISKTLEQGLRTEWDDYKNDKKKDLLPWYGEEVMQGSDTITVRDFEEAYVLLMRVANPLKETSPDLIRRAFRKMYSTNITEKIQFFVRRGIVDSSKPATAVKQTVPSDPGKSFGSDMQVSPTSTFISSFRADMPFEATYNPKKSEPKKIKVNGSPANVYEHFINGSWDLVASMTDRQPYRVKRYEIDSVIRTFNVLCEMCCETIPTFWGLSSATMQSKCTWNPLSCELMLSGDAVPQSQVPSHGKRGQSQCFQIVFCDDNIKVTRQSGDDFSDPDIYCLWKRKKPPQWKKY